MCRYGYYYFATCRHQQTVLYDFCSHAQPFATASNAAVAIADIDQGKEWPDMETQDAGGWKESRRKEGLAHDNTECNLPSARTMISSHTPGSSFDTGSVSITTEPVTDCSSLQADHPPYSSASSELTPVNSQDMAGLPLFGGTFRHWMSGGTAAAPKQSTIDAKVHISLSNNQSMDVLQDVGSDSGSPTQSAPRRQPGIREYTDEGSELPKKYHHLPSCPKTESQVLIGVHSNDILQHIAEYSRHHNVQRADSDGMSTGSNTAANQLRYEGRSPVKDSFGYIEADLDRMKEEVQQLRVAEAESERQLSPERPSGGYDTAISDMEHPIAESAAAKLQRQHERNAQSGRKVVQETLEQHPPPSPLDFPALSQSRKHANVAEPVTPEYQPCKFSYAHVVTTEKMDAGDHKHFSQRGGNNRSFESTKDGLASAASAMSRRQTTSSNASLATQDGTDEMESVIISLEKSGIPTSGHEEQTGKDKQLAAKATHTKHQPHFAQPTKSFARRTGDTMRKDSASVSPESPADESPSRSTKAKDPTSGTEKLSTQRQQKRKSLPGDWLNPRDPEVDAKDRDTGRTLTRIASTKTLDALAPSIGDRKDADRGMSKPIGGSTRHHPKQVPTESTIRNKTNSYMAPTTAAKQRSLATLGQESQKQATSQQKTEHSRYVASQNHQAKSPAAKSKTASSDNAHAQLGLDGPSVDTTGSPAVQKCQPNRYSDSPKLSPKQSRSPHSSTSPKAIAARREVQSPSKLPRSSVEVDAQTSQSANRTKSRVPPRCESLGSLPEVANVTTKRRTSHGHLLKPIVACLDAKGLLNKAGTSNAVIESYLQRNTLDSSVNVSERVTEAMTDVFNPYSVPLPDSIAGDDEDRPVRKVLPPHLRKARSSSQTSTLTTTIICDKSSARASCGGESRHASVTSTTNGTSMQVGSLQASDPRNASNSIPTKPRVSSLRATANEFKPMGSTTSDQIPANWQGALEFKPDEEWWNMDFGTRRAIQSQRAVQRNSTGQPVKTLPSQFSPPWQPTPAFQSQPLLGRMTYAGNFDTTYTSVDENGSPVGVQSGQILKPTASPGKKTVRWLLQSANGRHTPAKFGRAPPPNAAPFFEPSTPTISTTSDDTSPQQTPHSLRGWQIGSTSGRNQYGWAGGDGKEIKFVGYGPHAERDPNSVVDFNFQGQTSSYNTFTPNGFGDDEKENRASQECVAPRSQRQWAEKLGYSKFPCGNVEIVRAVEHMPFASELFGYCYDCMANS